MELDEVHKMFSNPGGIIGVNSNGFYQHDVIKADSDVIRK